VDRTIGIDIGTTSVKAVVVDDEGRVLARTRLPHVVGGGAAHRAEHDARAIWREAVLRSVADLRSRVPGPVAGIAVAAMVPSLAPVDADGVPLGPGLLYGDERGATGADGNPAASGEFEAFVAWAARHVPHASGFWPAQAVANAALCGTGAIDTSTAFTTMPLFTGTGWDASRCAALGIRPEQLPELVPGNRPAGRTTDGAAVAGGTIDAFGEQLVAGADEPGDVLVVCGTTLVVWAVSDGQDRAAAPGLWTVPHTTPGRTMTGGASNAGGLFVQRVRDLTGDTGDGGTGGRAGIVPGRVPVWVPYIRGERTPWNDPDRRASLHDLDLTHDAAAVRRAAYEASGFVIRHHLDLAGHRAQRIVATGGGTHVRPWLEAIADATGLPVDVVAEPEGAAIGAAFVARVAAGLEPDTRGATRWARLRERIEPDPAWIGPAATRYRRFRSLVDPTP
jgi:xylulokinase